MTNKADQSLRVFRDNLDRGRGIVLCRSHREQYLSSHKGSFACGAYGGSCEQCSNTHNDADGGE
jgi:hypothetical protein